ncbi:MAG: ribokinase [Microcoleaceae cyanobacterium]
MSLIVFGSINMDLVAHAPRLPKPGETLQGDQFLTIPGGKGANQAVAAAKLQTETHLVGRVGTDRFGQTLLTSLQTAGVETEQVKLTDTSSGVAIITVDTAGENTIVIIPGANGQVTVGDVEQMVPLLSQATALLLQLEVPIATVIAAAQVAHQAGVKVILDPAPAPESLPQELYALLDIITPNETEASRLVGFDLQGRSDYERATQQFQQWGVETAVIKLGGKGVFCQSQSEQFWQDPFPVDVVDTVAAGDAFNAGMAVGLDRGLSLHQAVTWGAAAGALAVTRSGAQSSLPDWETFQAFLKCHPSDPCQNS